MESFMSTIINLRSLFVLFTSAVSLPAATVSFSSDGTMSSVNWSTTKIGDSEGNASFSATQVLSGGNPGSYWHVSHSYGPRATTSSATISLAHLNSSFTWNPSIQGALNSVSFGFSADVIDDGQSDAVGLGVVMLQNGTYFTKIIASPSQAASWNNYSVIDAISADFRSGMNVPDFSTNGSMINFGFFTANGTALGSATNTLTAIDNVSLALNVTPIPEPSSIAFLSLLGGSLLIRSRRRETPSC
jgi:hypothetical protein